MSVQVKICGLKRPQDIRAVNEAKSDYAGFVFFEKSKRNISFETARELLPLLDSDIQSVAVCVSPDAALVRNISGLGFDIIQ
ncbi:MAG: phosphoribosylanthranilate isomerase, partial [Lachnospiraceae bacterium]|nr:phosphoribosylanthranilate isomerase [Lachnospiraceae bacterium]